MNTRESNRNLLKAMGITAMLIGGIGYAVDRTIGYNNSGITFSQERQRYTPEDFERESTIMRALEKDYSEN